MLHYYKVQLIVYSWSKVRSASLLRKYRHWMGTMSIFYKRSNVNTWYSMAFLFLKYNTWKSGVKCFFHSFMLWGWKITDASRDNWKFLSKIFRWLLLSEKKPGCVKNQLEIATIVWSMNYYVRTSPGAAVAKLFDITEIMFKTSK